MSMRNYDVTAIITVFNGAAFIARAVESLVSQSLTNIEILVVDDGSDDSTREILHSFVDERLRVIELPRTGRAASLALACREARGRYIANLDADDVCFRDRLLLQAAFLDRHADYAWVGCGEEQEDTRRGEHLRRVYPLTDAKIRRQSAKCIPYCHSSVMFRRSLIDEGLNYDPTQPFLIDFEFFQRVAAKYRVANLPDVLVKRYVRKESYFQSSFNASRQNRRLAWLCALAVKRFTLPVYFYAFPLARLVYPMLPLNWKRMVRSQHGLFEVQGG